MSARTLGWVLHCVMVAVTIAGLTLTPDVRAAPEDLRELAGRVEAAWRTSGGEITRPSARFVMEDEAMTLDLRDHASTDRATDRGTDRATPDRESRCRRVALIGGRGMSFHLTTAPGSQDDGWEVASAAGVIELHGCGTVPDSVKLKSDSGRGALETVIASAAGVLPPVSAILLERTGGALPSAVEPGPLPPLPPPGVRAAAAEVRLVTEAFTIARQVTYRAGEDGKGGGDLTLDEGCHHLELFAVEPRSHDGRRGHLDLDGALRRPNGDLLVEDKTVAPDVRLQACVASPTNVTLVFEGAPKGSPVQVVHASHPLPSHLPPVWPSDVRARVASVMLAHHAKAPTADAIVLTRGASGTTPVPFELEPGACYLAVAAMDRGRARGHGVALRVTVGGRMSQDEQGSKEDAALVAFCAQDDKHATMEVEARSAASGWGVAVFRIVSGVWSAGP